MQASHRDEPTSVKSVWTNVRNNHDNYLTSTIASPMFTNLSRYPIMISKALDEVWLKYGQPLSLQHLYQMVLRCVNFWPDCEPLIQVVLAPPWA